MKKLMFMFVSEMKINKKIVVFMIKYIWVYWRGKRNEV